MFTLHDLVWGIPVPAFVAALIMTVAWRPWSRTSPADAYWAGALAIGLAFSISFLGLRFSQIAPAQPTGSGMDLLNRLQRLLPIPPTQAPDWIFIIAIFCMVAGVIDGLVAMPNLVRRSLAGGLLLVWCWLFLRTVSTLNQLSIVGWTVGLALIFFVWWVRLDAFAMLHPGPLVPGLLTMVAGAVGMVIMMSGSQMLGQLGGAVAAAIGACFVTAWFARSMSLARGGVFTFVSLIAALLICSHFYAELTRVNGTLLLASAVLTTVGQSVPLRMRKGWMGQLGLFSIAFVPALIAVVLAAIDFAASMARY